MRKQRGFVAIVGLCILFGCAWLTYASQNETESRKYIKESQDINTVVQVNAADYRNQENTKRDSKVRISPKKYQYRNQSRGLLMTQDDYEVLLRIVEAEATGGGKQSKSMVANVVLNRVADKHFPNSVTEVVYQCGKNGVAQFSPITDGRFQKIEVTKETKNVVKQVLKGEDESGGALFFLNPHTSAASNLHWFQSNLRYLFDCGGHSFYCFKNS